MMILLSELAVLLYDYTSVVCDGHFDAFLIMPLFSQHYFMPF